MRAGLLTHALMLQRATEAVSAAGTVTNTWATFATVRAELLTLSVADATMAYGEADKTGLAFRIRHFHGLSTDDRVIWRGEEYEITSIVELGRRVMELHCEAVS